MEKDIYDSFVVLAENQQHILEKVTALEEKFDELLDIFDDMDEGEERDENGEDQPTVTAKKKEKE